MSVLGRGLSCIATLLGYAAVAYSVMLAGLEEGEEDNLCM